MISARLESTINKLTILKDQYKNKTENTIQQATRKMWLNYKKASVGFYIYLGHNVFFIDKDRVSVTAPKFRSRWLEKRRNKEIIDSGRN